MERFKTIWMFIVKSYSLYFLAFFVYQVTVLGRIVNRNAFIFYDAVLNEPTTVSWIQRLLSGSLHPTVLGSGRCDYLAACVEGS
ncbi:hypothetical protein [Enterococcus olivae]